jgi:hypothetical protein
MKYQRCFLSVLFWISLSLPCFGQAWNGIISTERAANWTYAGLPGDVPPDGAWTQSGSTIAACGSSGSPVSPSTCGITSALSSCGTNHYVLLAGTPSSPADFYLNATISVPSNCVLRGGGANATRLHFANGGRYNCNGGTAVACLGTSNLYAGQCSASLWPCPNADWTNVASTADWTANYSQGSTTITLDNITGITVNVTPIVLDQCDTGFTGSSGIEACTASTGAGAITSVTINGGGGGYALNDTGTIGCSNNFGLCYGASPAAIYKVTSVSNGVVTGVSITSGGGGYTYNSTQGATYGGQNYVTTAKTSGSGNGLQLFITGVASYDNNAIFTCAITMICTYESSANDSRSARSEQEVVLATAISGTGPYTVTLSRPIIAPDWAAARTPQAWWGSSGTETNAGIEDLELDQSAITGGGCSNSGCAQAINVNNASKVWVTGVASNKANGFHLAATIVANMLIANNYFYWTANASVVSYGVGSQNAVGNSLFENNILQGIVDPLNAAAPCGGCVAAYNFSVNDFDTASTALFSSSPMHAAATNYILEEGNIGPSTQLDGVHGPHFMNTFFRNYFNGFESNNGTLPNNNTVPVIVNAFSRYNNFLANVLGTAGYHTVYQCVPSSSTQQYCSTDFGSGPGYVHIWDIGFGDTSQRDFTNTPYFSPNDTLTASSFYRYGNYDVVNNSVQWNSSEVPTTDPNYPNPVPGSNNFPASFYNGVTTAHASCGTGLNFWNNPTTGTCPPYPPIGPDVTGGDIGMCTSGTYKWSRALTGNQCAGGSFNISVNGGFGNSNPAMRCYLNQMGGTPDGTGSMLSFNRASCYASDPSSGMVPAPPTNLTVTVQ